MQWHKFVQPGRCNDLKQIVSYHGLKDNQIFAVVDAGGAISEFLHHNEFNHWIVTSYSAKNPACPRGTEIEPTYSQKFQVLKDLGVWKEVAIEVMPPDFEVVDVENVYHLWEFQYIYSFGEDVRPIFTAPSAFDQTFDGINYHMEMKNGCMYVYFKDKENIPWNKKQALKNYVATPISTGVEFICEPLANADYGCMLIFPLGTFLDFGLEQPSY